MAFAQRTQQHDRMLRIRQEIHRNIVSEDTLKRYRKIVADINLRLKGEEKEFLELKAFVYETRDRIRDNVDKDPERRAYANILEVERRLDRVHGSDFRPCTAGSRPAEGAGYAAGSP